MQDSAAVNCRPTDIVLQCADLDAALAFYQDELGFRLDAVFPADAPRIAQLSGDGLRLKLFRGEDGSIPVLLPANRPSLAVSKFGAGGFGAGRAGMQYRDLIPDRYGGRFIASHIRIPKGGPVPDYVHHHDVRFQLIYCVNGWVKVAYEDQGEPMLMQAGDCFLQPPHIRHRVLECSDHMQVVEVACPAEHETLVEHGISLPTGVVDRERVFGGQRFVFHESARMPWAAGPSPGFSRQDTAIEAATQGIVSLSTVRAEQRGASLPLDHEGELRFVFVRQGTATLDRDGEPAVELGAADACAIPPGLNCALTGASSGLLLIDLAVPA